EAGVPGAHFAGRRRTREVGVRELRGPRRHRAAGDGRLAAGGL
ncbi:MAG: hypothetical protein AVDCRST_MAG55-1862, partial [uncultured Rubrobacteraceae bacterium]